jgi:glycerol-3-phosphate acyltransferase PlsY
MPGMIGRRGWLRFGAAGLIAYLVGSFPTADVVSRRAAREGVAPDLRDHGTGNPGAMNAAKVLGWRMGLAVLGGDTLKGALACAAGRRIAGDDGAYIAGIGAVAGHCLPPWSGFRGGKGVATSAGTSVICFPIYVPVDVALAAGTLALSSGQAGMATYVASSAFVGAAMLWALGRRRNLWGPQPSPWLPAYAFATSAIIAAKVAFAQAPMAHATAVEDVTDGA